MSQQNVVLTFTPKVVTFWEEGGDNMYCKYCGTQISDDAVFCEKCGKRIRRESKLGNPPVISTDYGVPYLPTDLKVYCFLGNGLF